MVDGTVVHILTFSINFMTKVIINDPDFNIICYIIMIIILKYVKKYPDYSFETMIKFASTAFSIK